jgi:hypothetical protein
MGHAHEANFGYQTSKLIGSHTKGNRYTDAQPQISLKNKLTLGRDSLNLTSDYKTCFGALSPQPTRNEEKKRIMQQMTSASVQLNGEIEPRLKASYKEAYTNVYRQSRNLN